MHSIYFVDTRLKALKHSFHKYHRLLWKYFPVRCNVIGGYAVLYLISWNVFPITKWQTTITIKGLSVWPTYLNVRGIELHNINFVHDHSETRRLTYCCWYFLDVYLYVNLYIWTSTSFSEEDMTSLPWSNYALKIYV